MNEPPKGPSPLDDGFAKAERSAGEKSRIMESFFSSLSPRAKRAIKLAAKKGRPRETIAEQMRRIAGGQP